MSERRAFQCPNCTARNGSPTSNIGALVNHTGVRCDYIVLDWTHRKVGERKKKDGSKEPVIEYTPITEPGCGGTLDHCPHGQRVCDVCPPQFEPGDPEPLRPLAEVLRVEKEARAERERLRQLTAQDTPRAKRTEGPTRIQMPFLGEAEPDRYVPPRGRRKKPT